MKIIHTSDWHLGLRFCGYDPSEEYTLFFGQLTKTVAREKPDALLIVGDVFDIPIPTNDLLERFENCLANLHEACATMRIIITSGNHDDCQWLEKQSARWSEFGVHIIGQLRKRDASYDIGRHIITISDTEGNPKGYIIGMPYMTTTSCPVLSEKIPLSKRLSTFMTALANRVEMINMNNSPVLLMAHCFVLRERVPSLDRQKATLVLEDLPLDSIDYLALGHTHSSKNVGSPKVRCCGSPWPITPKDFQRRSFSVVTIKEHKGEIKVSERWIKNKCPLVLVPKKASKAETVLRQLTAFPEEEQAFINLFVRAEDSANEKEFIKRCKEICTGKKARLCSVIWTQGDSMRFTNIADTSYLSYGQSLSNTKVTDLSELVENLQKSLNAQLMLLDKTINELHRKEDNFTASVNKFRTQLRNLEGRKIIQQRYERIQEEADYIDSLMNDPKYEWEKQFIDQYKQLSQANSLSKKNGETEEIKALEKRSKELAEKAKVLHRGIVYVTFDLERHKKKIENLLKQKSSKNRNNEKASNPTQNALEEHQKKEKELTQLLQEAQAHMKTIEDLLNIHMPKLKGVGNKTDNLVEQLEALSQEVIEVCSTLGDLKRKSGCRSTSVEDILANSNIQMGLWSTEIWKDRQFIETIIREHNLLETKKAMFDRVLTNLQKDINELDVDDKLANSDINPLLLLEYMDPWMAEQVERFKEQHSELERQQTQLRHRINDINLIKERLNDITAQKKEES